METEKIFWGALSVLLVLGPIVFMVWNNSQVVDGSLDVPLTLVGTGFVVVGLLLGFVALQGKGEGQEDEDETVEEVEE